MKIALVHDYIKEYGGAERVLETLHETWPDAPVYTTVYLPEFLGPHKERFKNWDIRTSFLQTIPFKEKLISLFRIISPFMFKSFDLSKFDMVIISATGAYVPNMVETKKNIVIARSEERATRQSHIKKGIASLLRGLAMTKRKGAIHICYCHTPPRYLYGFATARDWKKNLIFRAIGEIGNHFLRLVDYRSSQNVDYFIANSKNVAGRIKNFYRRDSVVIYPPVEIQKSVIASNQTERSEGDRLFDKRKAKQSQHLKGIAASSLDKLGIPRNDNEDKSKQYFLAGGRLARPKHIDLIVRACRELKVPLKVFGRGFGGYEKEVKSQKSKVKSTMQNSKVNFVGEVSDEEKMDLMRNARAYIFASEDEDFGITPVEAMSVGTPVIAYKSGGVVESVVDPSTSAGQGATGLFFDELTVESLSRAIKQFNRVKRDNAINPSDCIKQARKFSKERFKREIKEFVERKLKT